MTQRVAVIGWNIAHTLSPIMHNAAFRALGLDWEYDRIDIPPDIVRQSLRELRDHGFVGVNVTIPHKQAVMPYIKPDERAKAIGAVNTIDFRTNIGTNTDVSGFMDDLAAHGIEVSSKRVVVLGAGGAARAAVYGLANAGAQITIVNRTPDKAQALLDSLNVDGAVGDASAAAHADVIINCTSVGMQPNIDESPLPDDIHIPPNVVLYDMIYRPAQTKLMRQVEAAGGRAVSGLGMLVRQGAAAFELWTGVPAPVEVMFEAAQAALHSKS